MNSDDIEPTGVNTENQETKTFAAPGKDEVKFDAPSGGGLYPTPMGATGSGRDRSFIEIDPDLKNSLDKTKDLVVPKRLIAFFPGVNKSEDDEEAEETKGGDKVVAYFETVDAKLVGEDGCRFNEGQDGEDLARQDDMKVTNYKDLVTKINTFDQDPDQISKCMGYFCCVASLGLYYCVNRRYVKDGHFGFFSSSGMHLIKEPGYHVLYSCVDNWKDDIQISSDEYIRQIGSKFLVTVPENYIGGAVETATEEYVIFKQGRYVLEDASYGKVRVIPLLRQNGETMLKIGPINIVYIKEGFVGGAYQINTGIYEILHPGPPYFLHEKDYESIHIVERSIANHWFPLGPYRFITVKEGFLAGAYHKQSGDYQILIPGNTYYLNDKDYELENPPDVVRRVENFSNPNNPGFVLGPYTFMTVKKGYVAGAFKVKGGDFIVMPPGYTYQLHEKEWRDPVLVRKDKHIVKCGPLTFVTVKPDEIVGAYRIRDGKFIEFTNPNKEYQLHEKEYHDGHEDSGKQVINIHKYSYEPQEFGPFNIITIKEGFVGVFEKEGQLEIVTPGFYKKSSEYKILPSIPIKVYTDSAPSRARGVCKFKTKDSVDMTLTADIIWYVTDPRATALILGEDKDFHDLKEDVYEKFTANLTKYAKRFNRDELLPTTHNIIAKTGTKALGVELDEVINKSLENTDRRLNEIQEATLEAMVDVAKSSNWGITIKGVNLYDVVLEDYTIIQDLDQVSQSLVDTSLRTYKGELEVVTTNTQKNTTLKKEQTKIEVNQLRANSQNEVRKIEAVGLAEVKKIQSESSAAIDVHKQKATSEIEVIESTTKAEQEAKSRRIQLEIKNKERLETARVNAEAMKMRAEAEYDKTCKENEAVKGMTDKQFKLQMADESIKAMENMGNASWKMPDQILQFYESFSPYLRMGRHVTAGELMKSMGGTGGKKRR